MSTLQPRDPYKYALRELQQLSEHASKKDVLLRCDKRGHFTFEEKTIWGKIKRFFTVTILRSKEYNLDSNIQKIGKLFEVVPTGEFEPLKAKINELIEHAAQSNNDRITRLKLLAHTEFKPLNYEELTSITKFRETYDSLSFAAKREGVMQLAEQVQSFTYDKNTKKEAYAKNINWLAEKCASFSELETAFKLYTKAISETGDQSSVEQFIEVGLLLKRFTVIPEVLKTQKAKARIDRIQSFGEGPIESNGFKANEWNMLETFAKAYESPSAKEPVGYKRLKGQEAAIHDFLIYAAGNTQFNRRLKTALENDSITDESLLSAVDYFATFSFKCDPVKWKSNQAYAEHMNLVQQLVDKKEQLAHQQARLEKVGDESAPKPKFIPNKKGLRATPDVVVVEVENIPGKTKGLTRTKARQKVTKTVVPGAKATPAPVWIKAQERAYEQGTALSKQQIAEAIPLLEQEIAQLQRDLKELAKQFPQIVGKDPEKLQMPELPVLDSVYRFHEQMTEEMRKAFDLEKNPFFETVYQNLQGLTDSYDWIQKSCFGTNGYQTGDISFVNELKKNKVTGKAATDFTDKVALSLFPFGHLAIIDEEHGSTAFSHQRLAFDHSPVALAEYLYYDTYRIDFKALALPTAFEALKRGLEKDEKTLEDEMSARNMTENEYLLHELEEKFAIKVAEELEQSHQPDARKWEGIESPDFSQIKTLAQLDEWRKNVNEGREKEVQFELYELFEIPEDCDIDIQNTIRELRVDYLKDLYKGITNDDKTQFKAFMQSWRFAGPLSLATRITDKAIDPYKVQIAGEMCCSQFAQLIILRALQKLNSELSEAVEGQKCLRIPQLTEKRYEAATTEFVLKEFRDVMKPIQAPPALQDIVHLPRRDFLTPIPIDSTVAYMAKRLFRTYQ
ncbi:MAG: hypothetical protein JSR37_09560 [Verrucomicrobia bacterium]|nr:hypothetical protein [Verrucomicrobiota bacterium]MBS0637115.1 hypothetical protein [Verrucomicrobiota bacterium]